MHVGDGTGQLLQRVVGDVEVLDRGQHAERVGEDSDLVAAEVHLRSAEEGQHEVQ